MHNPNNPMLKESDNWPKCLKFGGFVAKIYRYDDRGSWEFIVSWYFGKTRRQKKFSKEDQAMIFAKEQLELLCLYKLGLAEMHESDRNAFLIASDLLRPLGIGLVAAVKDYVAAAKVMGERGSPATKPSPSSIPPSAPSPKGGMLNHSQRWQVTSTATLLSPPN